MSRFILQALTNQPITVYGDGKQTRSFLLYNRYSYRVNVADGSSKAKGEVVNVGNAQEVTILELAEKIKEVAKCKSTIEFHPLPKDDPKRRCPNTNKLERLVGWKPNVCFEEGLKRTVAWFSQKSRH